jgi:hypothetical protein
MEKRWSVERSSVGDIIGQRMRLRRKSQSDCNRSACHVPPIQKQLAITIT